MNKKILIIAGVIALSAVLGLGIYKSDASQADTKLSFDDITNLVSSQYPGTITEMEFEKKHNRAVYEVEIVNDGMEYDLEIDGNSGEIIKLKQKKLSIHDDDKEVIELDEKSNNGDSVKENKSNTDQNLETKIEKKQKPNQNKKGGNKNTVIDATEAIKIAQHEFPGTVTDVELDEDDGRLIYEIEIKANGEEAEFEIDAMTGEIIVIEIDD